MKDTMSLEKEVQNYKSQNELLRSKLYARDLDQNSVSNKIETIKDCVNGTEEDKQRIKSSFVEQLADYIFRFNNLGVTNIMKETQNMIKMLYDYSMIYGMIQQEEVFEWTWKLYQNLIQVSGIKQRKKKPENKLSSLDETAFMSGLDSTAQFVSPKNNNVNFTQVSTMREMQKSPQIENVNERNCQQELDQECFYQMLNMQAQSLEDQLMDDASILL